MAVKDYIQHEPGRHASGRPSEPIEVVPPRGVRIVSFGHGDRVEVVASPASRYLLPELASGFSLVRKETRAPGGDVIFYGGDVVIDVMGRDEADVERFQGWFESPRGELRWGDAIESDAAPAVGGFVGELSIGRGSLPESENAMIIDKSTSNVIELPAADDAPAIEPLSPDAPVEKIASRIHQLTGLSDEELARLFKVARETFNRWRSGVLTNPTPGSRRRLGLLLRLLDDLGGRGVAIKDWLLNNPVKDGLTAYELLERGRIDEVAYLAAAIGGGYDYQAVEEAEVEEELVFGEDDHWEVVDLQDADDAE